MARYKGKHTKKADTNIIKDIILLVTAITQLLSTLLDLIKK